MNARLRCCAAVSFLAIFAAAEAIAAVSVFRPVDGDQVVLQLGAKANQLSLLKASVERSPRNAEALSRYVDALISAARISGNERYYGIAERALLNAPGTVRSALATKHAYLLQSRHDFAGAEALLTQFLTHAPRNYEAVQMRAQIRLHLNRPNEAMRDCATMAANADLVSSTACFAQARAALGDIERAYQLIKTSLSQVRLEASQHDPTLSWGASVAAELAARLGFDAEAATWHRLAYERDPDNHFARLSYLDWLLARDNPDIALVVATAGGSSADRLRVVLANRNAESVDAGRLQLAWQEMDRRGERDHLRDRARFELQVLGEIGRAHATAWENFQTHRAPDDALLLATTAARTGDEKALDELRAWRAESRYRDVRLDRLLEHRS